MRYEITPKLKQLAKLGMRISPKLRSLGEKDKLTILDTENLPVQEDGLILQEDNGQERAFALTAEVLNDPKIAVVLVEGRKSERVNRLSPVKTEDDKNYFVRLVSTWPVQGGYSTKPQDNSLRVVSVQGGLLQIFSVAIVSRLYDERRGAYHFLVVQEMYNAKLYRDKSGKVVAEDDIVTANEEYPGFNNWDAMQKLVDEMIPLAKRGKLPLLSRRRKNTPLEPLELGEEEAEVIFFDLNKGFGFARTRDEQARYFNWQNSASEDRLPYFHGGQKVVYGEVRTTERGEQLIGVKAVVV